MASNFHRQIADKEIEHGNAEISSNNQGSNLGVDDQASIKLEIDSKRKSKANCPTRQVCIQQGQVKWIPRKHFMFSM